MVSGPQMTRDAGLTGRRVVLGICGGIAAYKAVEVCRRLIDVGAYVVPVMTPDAGRFIGKVTVSALASEPVRTSLWTSPETIPHTQLGQKADVIVVVPATARLIGTYAAGIADGLLTATLLATRSPVIVCPAMHTEMWEHPAVQDNLDTLRRRGVIVVEPGVGRLAGGDAGAGRLAEPVDIVAAVVSVLNGGKPGDRPDEAPPMGFAGTASTRAGLVSKPAAPSRPDLTLMPTLGATSDLAGRTVLVTAGGTREPIDAVRVITNRSSGKQGYAIAEEALSRGAEVVLVTTVDRTPPDGAVVIRVSTAAEMQEAVMDRASSCDVVVMAAAVADFRPKAPVPGKLKKDDGVPEIILEPTHDFLVDLGRRKGPGQALVGFAAETSDLIARATEKLQKKGLDIIVANDVSAPGAGFEHDTNQVTIISGDGTLTSCPLAAKREVARAVFDAVVLRLSSTNKEIL